MPNLQQMFNWAVNWCNRSNVGYDQSYRNMQVRPSDQVTCFDCSSFTFFAMWQGGGFDIPSLGFPSDLSGYTQVPHLPNHNAWDVPMMESFLPALGWTSYPVGTIQPQAGDICVITNQHCEIMYEGAQYIMMGARNPGLPLVDQVSIHTVGQIYFDANFNTIWRYGTGPTPPTPGFPIPIWLLKAAKERSTYGNPGFL